MDIPDIFLDANVWGRGPAHRSTNSTNKIIPQNNRIAWSGPCTVANDRRVKQVICGYICVNPDNGIFISSGNGISRTGPNANIIFPFRHI